MQSAIQLPQQEFASDCKEENTLADRADLMAELESYLQDPETLARHGARRISRSRLKVLAEFL